MSGFVIIRLRKQAATRQPSANDHRIRRSTDGRASIMSIDRRKSTVFGVQSRLTFWIAAIGLLAYNAYRMHRQVGVDCVPMPFDAELRKTVNDVG